MRYSSSLARSVLSAVGSAGAAVIVIGALTWPLLLTGSAFAGDWLTHLWLMWHQSLNIRDSHTPSLFLNNSQTVFYPIYAFYGGTLYALGGALSLLLGDAPLRTYELTYVLGFLSAYGGWYWMARSAGLGRWIAQLPGLVFITSPYYLTLVYGRGDWTEFMGVSMIPLMLAAGLSTLWSEQRRPATALVLAISSTVFFGSHNLTTLWGSTILAFTGGVMIGGVPAIRQRITRRGVMRLARLVVPAALVSAWFVVPALAFRSHTNIGSQVALWQAQVRSFTNLLTLERLFTLSRATILQPNTDFVLALPTFAIAWTLLSLMILPWVKKDRVWTRILLLLAGTTVLIAVFMTHGGLVLLLPRLYTFIQFTYRLESFVLLGLSGAILAILVIVHRGTPRLRLWVWTISPAVAVSVVGALQQVDAYPKDPNPGIATSTTNELVYHRTDGKEDYADASLPKIRTQLPAALRLSPAQIHRDRASVSLRVSPGKLIYTNIASGPELLDFSGAKVVGVDPRGHVVLTPDSAAPSGSGGSDPQAAISRISARRAASLPIRLGRLLTVVGLAGLIFEFVMIGWGALRDLGHGFAHRREAGVAN